MNTLTITKPDDFHIHLRDGAYLATTVAHAAKQFSRAIIMPNLIPPITTVDLAWEYLQRIVPYIPADFDFTPLMTLYLTDQTNPQEIIKAAKSAHVYAVKLYPAGATTNSASGLTQLGKSFPVFEAMQEQGLPLLIHGEVTENTVDIFDREKIFIEQQLSVLCQQFPDLKIVVEHITTKDAVEFVQQANHNVAATITAHHLLLNRNDLLAGGIKPHYYCLPIVKRAEHQQALITAAISGNPKFFLGTDSAPHSQDKKENTCGCAGVYTAHAAIELYAQIFAQHNALDKLEAFASKHGADFYNLPRNEEKITLTQQQWRVPDHYDFGDEKLIPYAAGQTLNWKII